MQQHYRSLCDGLAAQNAVLKSQLAAAVKALSCERASSQAELHALRQKVCVIFNSALKIWPFGPWPVLWLRIL